MHTDPNRLSLAKATIENILNWLGTLIFPGVLVALSAVTLIWQFFHHENTAGGALQVRVWEQVDKSISVPNATALGLVSAAAPSKIFETELSTNDFWFSVDIPTALGGKTPAIEFPSRHAFNLTCWDSLSDKLLGTVNRLNAEGFLATSRAGFLISSTGVQGVSSLLCRGSFRGPAKITATAWDPDLLSQAQKEYLYTGTLLEAGMGILAITMLITALINRSWLYWAFVGWLLLSMRMAALSAGVDFLFFGYALNPHELVEARKWTVCMYFSMTVALFGLLFKSELAAVKANLSLTSMQLTAVLLPVACFFLTYENLLQSLWLFVSIGAAVGFYSLYRILRRARSRVALWYATSIVITLLASINEVLSAALGVGTLLVSVNSVTGAISSALLVTAAVAEHMRADRLEKLEAQRILRTAYEDSPIGLFTITPQGEIIKTNPVFRKMLQGNASIEIQHLSTIFDERVLRDIASLEGSKLRAIELQTRIQDPSRAAEKWYAIKASTTDGLMIEGTLQDITERYAANTRLEFLANHDSLTECFNLRGISRALGRLTHPPSAVAYFDLNHFKLINDLYGHAAGDIVLVQVAERMQAVIGNSGMLSRVGGDAFVIAFTGCTVAHATTLCESIVNAISGEPYRIGTQRFSLNVSAGLIGTERFGDSTLKEIISAADNLCRVAKKRPNQRLMVMQADDNFFRYHKDELQILSCLERGEVPKGLFLVMQPEISLTQPFDSLNFEVLLRMRTSDGSIIPAGIIIEAAEMYGKMAIIDRWVVTTAIAWLEAHLGDLKNTRFVSINLSGGSLNDEAFTEEIFTLFAQYPEVLSLVCIEITESVALTDVSNVQRFIDRVRMLGAKVAIDDFGAGYSSFGYLRSLSVDALKLDGSLVKDATRNAAGLAIIQAIGSLVANLGMKSIGEYAEDLPTIKALVNAGIDYAQGYGISKPVMPDRILSAKSSADFIEDADILAFITQLQSREDRNLSLFEVDRNGFNH